MNASKPQSSPLFDEPRIGAITIKNRIVMAPMTRARSPELRASDDNALYYAQRAGAGLIISEGTPVSEEAQGYIHLPGIYSDEQIAAWRTVTDAVHARGGRIFAQLWHVGRNSHHSLQPGGGAPVSSTSMPAAETSAFAFKDDGTADFVPTSPPRALRTEEVPRIVEDFRVAAVNAVEARFDGIEIHGATGYLFEQFLNPKVNDRIDQYGGSIENRARLLMETVTAIADAIGPERTAVRLSPHAEIFDHAAYDEAEETFLHLAEALSGRGLAFVHLHDLGPFVAGNPPLISDRLLKEIKLTFGGPVVLTGGLTKDRATDLVRRGLIDLAGFGRPYISNPDLAERLRNDWPLNPPDASTFYGGGSEGYTDYRPYAGQA